MSTKIENNRPSHAIFVIHGEGENARWTKIGAAWLHKDKQGFHLVFDAYPAGNGRAALREIDYDRETPSNTGG